ncbi:hypothetical protein K435DRAFT_728939 [Dendrothele bispora CBS 962.96]|uniref:Family A G protein-coupled receptor-like protein n=1 Tax=Dendrothele bispora (strain CBS 962.96) TaxID=1314807 RepID=A0A4S8LLR3_DENBC|nr:hypothetical protein K435DRAFT_728939 [Dendrothele bispora CBS 962.96]
MDLMSTETALTRIVITLAIACLLYGIYVMLFSICIHVLLKRRRKNTVLHLVTMSLLFICATIGVILDVADTVHTLLIRAGFKSSQDNGVIELQHILEATILITYVVTNAIADLVLLHRCLVIWTHKKMVVVPPMIISLANNTIAVVAIFSRATGRNTGPETSSFNSFGGYIMFAFLIVNAVTHVCLTAMIAGRIWWIRREVNGLLGHAVQRRYKTTITIILESGIIYPFALIAWLIIQSVTYIEFYTQYAILIQLVGIAPTSIIVRAGLGVAVENIEETLNFLVTASDTTPGMDSSVLGPFQIHHDGVQDASAESASRDNDAPTATHEKTTALTDVIEVRQRTSTTIGDMGETESANTPVMERQILLDSTRFHQT